MPLLGCGGGSGGRHPDNHPSYSVSDSDYDYDKYLEELYEEQKRKSTEASELCSQLCSSEIPLSQGKNMIWKVFNLDTTYTAIAMHNFLKVREYSKDAIEYLVKNFFSTYWYSEAQDSAVQVLAEKFPFYLWSQEDLVFPLGLLKSSYTPDWFLRKAFERLYPEDRSDDTYGDTEIEKRMQEIAANANTDEDTLEAMFERYQKKPTIILYMVDHQNLSRAFLDKLYEYFKNTEYYAENLKSYIVYDKMNIAFFIYRLINQKNLSENVRREVISRYSRNYFHIVENPDGSYEIWDTYMNLKLEIRKRIVHLYVR